MSWNEIGEIATGIYEYDFGEGSTATTVSQISGWLEANVGELNSLIFSCFSGANPGMGLEERAIFRHLYLKSYYEKESRKILQGVQTTSTETDGSGEIVTSDWTELREGDSYIKRVATLATPATKTQASKTFLQFSQDTEISLKDLVYKYNLYRANPAEA